MMMNNTTRQAMTITTTKPADAANEEDELPLPTHGGTHAVVALSVDWVDVRVD